MRGFTEFAGRLTRLVYSREHGTFLAESVPHSFGESGGPGHSCADPLAAKDAARCPNSHSPCPTHGDDDDDH